MTLNLGVKNCGQRVSPDLKTRRKQISLDTLTEGLTTEQKANDST